VKQTSLKVVIATALLLGASAFAQLTDDPRNNIQGTSSQVAGDVLGTFVPQLGGTLPVGLVADGGGFWGTDITNDAVGNMDATGALLSSFTGLGNPIGITTDGTDLYIGDTTTAEVHVQSTTGTLIRSFDVSAISTFPEGLAYTPSTGNIHVVDGGGSVGEFSNSGTLLNTYPLLGSSQDGIAYDGVGYYYVYDSGTDTIRRYDSNFSEVESFGGTSAAGFSTGEGVAYADNIVYVVAASSNIVVLFDAGRIEVPTLSEMGLIAMIGAMLLASIVVMRRRNA
jgi:hypothetical protein